jgi:hypothetical protein
VSTIEFTDVRGPQLRVAAIGMLGAAAVWNLLPVHPPLACPLRSATGIPCPMCGMTRAVVAAVHGNVLASLAFNPFGIVVVAVAIYVIVTARLPVARAPAWLVFAVVGALWLYNVFLNPTFS